jgi:hypothetical protein
MAMVSTPDRPAYPVAEMTMAPAQAGYPLEGMFGVDMRFGIHVAVTLSQLLDFGTSLAKEHAEISRE